PGRASARVAREGRVRSEPSRCEDRARTPIAALAEIVVGIAGELGPHVRPVDVGANLRERNNAEGARTAGSMTLGAVGREYSLAALDGRRIGPVRRGWWRQRAQEALDALHRRQAEFTRDSAVTERRTDHHLPHRIVQAVPMQRPVWTNSLARIQIPHRLHVAVADGLVIGKVQHAELDRVEGIDPTRSPGWAALRPSQGFALLQQALAYKRDEDKPIGDLVEPGHPHLGGHRRNQVIGGETIVCRTAREKTQIA